MDTKAECRTCHSATLSHSGYEKIGKHTLLWPDDFECRHGVESCFPDGAHWCELHRVGNALESEVVNG